MKLRLLTSAPDPPHEHQFLTSFLINDRIAVDAGCIGFYREPGDQAKIDHVFLTHSHADHICSLPTLLMNTYEDRDDGVIVHGHEHVLDCLHTDVFNDRVWPSFKSLSEEGRPPLRLDRIESEQVLVLDDLSVTPVSVHHVVPTFGYIVEDADATIVLCPDTGPTERIWEVANQRDNLKAVFLGAAFPDDMEEMARISAHLTASQFGREAAKVEGDVVFVAVHIKPRYRQRIIRELGDLGFDSLEVGECGREYSF